MRELLDQQHSDPCLRDVLHRGDEALDDDRRQPERELVDEHELRAARRAPAQARPSAARRPRGSAPGRPALLELGEELERERDAAAWPRRGRERVGRDAEVVLDRQHREQSPTLGDDGEPAARIVSGRRLVRSSPSRVTLPDGRAEDAGDGKDERRLAGAVRAEQRGHLARRDRERDIVEHGPCRHARRAARRSGAARLRSRKALIPQVLVLRVVLVVGSQVRAHDVLVAKHLRRRAGRDQLAEVEHRRRLAARRDEAHVVVDEDDERPERAPGSLDHRSEVLGLLVRAGPRRARRAARAAACRRRPWRPRSAAGHVRRDRRPSRGRRRGPTNSIAASTSARRRRARRPSSARGSSRRCRTPTAARSPAPSGTCVGAPSARGGSRPCLSRSSPNAVIEPVAGLTKPLSTLKNVVLPAPFGPIRPHVPPGNDDAHLVDRCDAAEAHGEVLDLDHARCLRSLPADGAPDRREACTRFAMSFGSCSTMPPGAVSSTCRSPMPKRIEEEVRVERPTWPGEMNGTHLDEDAGDDRTPEA